MPWQPAPKEAVCPKCKRKAAHEWDGGTPPGRAFLRCSCGHQWAVCGSKRASFCLKFPLGTGARCKLCGQKGAASVTTHGAKSLQAREAMETRKEFLDALRGQQGDTAKALVVKLRAIALDGSLEAIRYCLDQLYGGPKTSVTVELSDREQIAAMVRVTARHLTGEDFERWLTDLQAELGQSSSAT